MKKLISCALLTCMLFSTTAYADGIDLSSLTTQELISLHAEVDELLGAKSQCELDTIYQGYYVVGEDIKEGSYLVTRTDAFEKTPFWIIKVYENEEAYENRERTAIFNLKSGENAQLNLKDGMVIDFGTGYGVLSAVEKPSWKP